MTKRIVAGFFGTFWLTFGGGGAAVFAAGFPQLGIGFLGVPFAGGDCIGQLWLFRVAPLAGAAVAGLLAHRLCEHEGIDETIVVEQRRAA